MTIQATSIDQNAIVPLLDGIAKDHYRLTGFGGIRGILLVDQDAKVIAKNAMFGLKKPWDMGAIAAALHGVAKQASAYFQCAALDKVTITFGNLQLFVQAIGSVDVEPGRAPRELLLAVLADEKVKAGLVTVQLQRVVPRILEAVRRSAGSMRLLALDERSVKDFLLAAGTP